MFSLHGLIRGNNPELGRDPDTGGQVIYVLEMGKILSAQKGVDKVYLFTREVHGKNISDDYARSFEKINEKFFIIRIPFGPKRYLRKESLWPYLTTFVDNTLSFLRKNKISIDVFHGHYADAGWASMCLASILGKSHIFTGHSLGRVKLGGLLSAGISFEEIEKRYRISARIEAEEVALDSARLVISSTDHEREDQYSLYDHYNSSNIQVIPPAVNLNHFYPKDVSSKKLSIWKSVSRFLTDMQKPIILSICRPDYKKNTRKLIDIYAKSPRLQKKANLWLFLGVRKDIEEMERNSKEVLKELLLKIDAYDLYGKVAYPKSHHLEEVPDIYRMAVKSQGVFVHPALEENFGLTLIEAASCGLPLVATKIGGPFSIVNCCQNGILVDPLNEEEIENSIWNILSNKELWKKMSKNGITNVQKNYSWNSHVKKYLKLIKPFKKKERKKVVFRDMFVQDMTSFDRLLLCDIDNTLIGDRDSLKNLFKIIQSSKMKVAFGLATGRNLESIHRVLKKWAIPQPNFIISSVGSELFYGKNFKQDLEWSLWLDYRWDSSKVREILSQQKDLVLQPSDCQNSLKISYYINEESQLNEKKIKKILRKENISCNVIKSHGSLLDILPVRCSKGLALRYFSSKWNIPFDHILVAGDSGNDVSMLRGEVLGVVVGNYSSEIEMLREEPRIFFAEGKFAQGIIEGIEHYSFLGESRMGPFNENFSTAIAS